MSKRVSLVIQDNSFEFFKPKFDCFEKVKLTKEYYSHYRTRGCLTIGITGVTLYVANGNVWAEQECVDYLFDKDDKFYSTTINQKALPQYPSSSLLS